jgi:hypothetical protein
MSSVADDGNVDYRLLLNAARGGPPGHNELDDEGARWWPVLLLLLERQTRTLEQILAELTAMTSSRRDREGPRTHGTTAEVAALLRYDPKWVRKHGEALGGWKKEGRGGRWKFPLDGIEERARAITSRKPPTLPEPQPPTSAAGDQTIDLTPRPRM